MTTFSESKLEEEPKSKFIDKGYVYEYEKKAYSKCHKSPLVGVLIFYVVDNVIERIGRTCVCLGSWYDEKEKRYRSCFKTHARYNNSPKTAWMFNNMPVCFNQETWKSMEMAGPMTHDRGFGFYCRRMSDGSIKPFNKTFDSTFKNVRTGANAWQQEL